MKICITMDLISLLREKKPEPQIFRFTSKDGSYERTSVSLLLHLKAFIFCEEGKEGHSIFCQISSLVWLPVLMQGKQLDYMCKNRVNKPAVSDMFLLNQKQHLQLTLLQVLQPKDLRKPCCRNSEEGHTGQESSTFVYVTILLIHELSFRRIFVACSWWRWKSTHSTYLTASICILKE